MNVRDILREEARRIGGTESEIEHCLRYAITMNPGQTVRASTTRELTTFEIAFIRAMVRDTLRNSMIDPGFRARLNAETEKKIKRN